MEDAARTKFSVADDSDREGLPAIWQELKTEESALCRTERFCEAEEQKARESFFWEPFQFKQPWSGAIKVGKNKLESHLMESYSYALRNASVRQTRCSCKSKKVLGYIKC